MAKADFKTIGRVKACDLRGFGFVFRIELLDGSDIVLPYACQVNSTNDAGQRFGMHWLAQLAMAVNMPTIIDTDDLIGLEMIVEHDGTAVAKLRPVQVVRVEYVPTPSLWHRLAARWSARHG